MRYYSLFSISSSDRFLTIGLFLHSNLKRFEYPAKPDTPLNQMPFTDDIIDT